MLHRLDPELIGRIAGPEITRVTVDRLRKRERLGGGHRILVLVLLFQYLVEVDAFHSIDHLRRCFGALFEVCREDNDLRRVREAEWTAQQLCGLLCNLDANVDRIDVFVLDFVTIVDDVRPRDGSFSGTRKVLPGLDRLEFDEFDPILWARGANIETEHLEVVPAPKVDVVSGFRPTVDTGDRSCFNHRMVSTWWLDISCQYHQITLAETLVHHASRSSSISSQRSEMSDHRDATRRSRSRSSSSSTSTCSNDVRSR